MNFTHTIKGVIVGASAFATGIFTAYSNGNITPVEWWGAGASALTALGAYFGVAVGAPAYTARQSGKSALPVDESAVDGMPVE